MRLETFCNEKNLSKSTKSLYNSCVKLYEEINGLTLDELIKEADMEEEQRIRWKHRKLKDRLIQFRKYLFNNKSQGTANRYFGCIKTIYRHFEIELQDLPSFNSKQIDLTYQMDYNDLVTKEEIIDAYYEANNEVKNIIVFAISTGLSKIDMLKLSIRDFLDACNYNYNEKELIEVLYEIKSEENLIPCFKGCRQKTGVKYITFCSPEATEHIIQRLIGRDAEIRETYHYWKEIADTSTDPKKKEIAIAKLATIPTKLEIHHNLFDISDSHLSYSFRKINNKLKLGKVGKFNKMRCHMLRKWQASALLNCEEVSWSKEEIDTLQGRLQDMTHRAYFHVSIENLYKKYCACVDELMLFKSIHKIDEEAYEKLKTENNFYKKEIVRNENKLEEQQKTIDKILENQKELEQLLGL